MVWTRAASSLPGPSARLRRRLVIGPQRKEILPLGDYVSVHLADDVDATVFIDFITPFNEDTSSCTGGLTTLDIDDDTIDDVFVDVVPGTPVCFDIIPAENTTVPPAGDPQVFTAYVDVLGDFITVLDTREVYFLVPPETPVE